MGLGVLIGLTEAAAPSTSNAVGEDTSRAPVLSWEGDGGRIYLEIDCIPTITDSRGGTITDFALEDGTSIADHLIRKPQSIKLEVNQTNTPIVIKTNPHAAADVMKLESIDLKIEPTKFQATGLLFLSTGAVGLAKSAVNAIGGALGLGEAFSGPPPIKASVLTAVDPSADRINALYDDLTKAYEQAAQFTLDWLGRSWAGLVIESFDYSRSAGKQLGVFSLNLKKVSFVKTAQANALQIPAELTMSLPVNAGNKPGTKLTGSAKSAVAANPALAAKGI
jgi:hypothetical protein